MTLFKKIFDSHSKGVDHGLDHPPATPQPMPTDLDLQDVFILSPDLRGGEPAAPAPDPFAPASRATPEPAPVGLEDDGDERLSMAERAALAQVRMEATQAAMVPRRPPAVAQSPRGRVISADLGRMVEVPKSTEGRAGRRAGRVKTRLLGFDHDEDAAVADPLGSAPPAETGHELRFPVGWLVVVRGPGRGRWFALSNGASMIGRGEGQTVRLDFGDSSISRQQHAAIAFDSEQNKFFLGHGGKSNIIRLNDRPVLSTEELGDGDLIRIGETTLRLVALCGPDFGWDKDDHGDA